MDWKQKAVNKTNILENNTQKVNYALVKAKNEEINLKKFLQILNQDNISYESFLKEPEPDFLLFNHDMNNSIGLEVTSLNLDYLKGCERQIEFMINNARDIFEANNTDLKYDLSISFSWDNVINRDIVYLKKNKKEIICDILQVVQRIEPIKFNKKSFIMNKVFDFHNSKFINKITVRNLVSKKSSWTRAHGTIVQEVQCVRKDDLSYQDLINNAINKKLNKPLNYKVEYNEIWLLIYASENTSSTLFTLDNFNYNKVYYTVYDKVYLMMENKLVLLKTDKV